MRVYFLKKAMTTLIICFVYFFTLSANADHLRDKSNEEAVAIHEFRVNTFHENFKTVLIEEYLKNSQPLKTSKHPSVSNLMESSDLLSVLYFDGKEIQINQTSDKFDEQKLIYSMSIAKSFVSVLVGHAICDGLIDYESEVIDFLPETRGSLFEKVGLRDLLNMTTGDREVFGGSSMRNYAYPILMQKQSIVELLRGKKGNLLANKNFFYSDINTDIVINMIDRVSPEGFAEYFSEKITKNAQFKGKVRFLIDRDNWLVGHGFMYADREDFLNFGRYIYSEWEKGGCLGRYLKNAYDNRVRTGKPGDDYQNYGAFFWFDKPRFPFFHLSMLGHGGQRVIVNLDNGAVLSVHSIRGNWDTFSLEKIMN